MILRSEVFILMNTATRNLEDDHVHILRHIDVIEFITLNEISEVENLETIVDIIRNQGSKLF